KMNTTKNNMNPKVLDKVTVIRQCKFAPKVIISLWNQSFPSLSSKNQVGGNSRDW
ncbi:hypothetical protein CU098_007859, partial [Rhizopus stolonifer]